MSNEYTRIILNGGTTTRLQTAGKYCDKDILVTASVSSGDTVNVQTTKLFEPTDLSDEVVVPDQGFTSMSSVDVKLSKLASTFVKTPTETLKKTVSTRTDTYNVTNYKDINITVGDNFVIPEGFHNITENKDNIDVSKLQYVNVRVPVPTLEELEKLEITENGTYEGAYNKVVVSVAPKLTTAEVSASTSPQTLDINDESYKDYDGFSQVDILPVQINNPPPFTPDFDGRIIKPDGDNVYMTEVRVEPIPSDKYIEKPTKSLDINSNGTNIDVTNFAKVNVQVADDKLVQVINKTIEELPAGYLMGVEDVGDYTFYNCTSLRSICMPNTVQTIGTYAFNGCIELTDVEIGDNVKSIGNSAFASCTNLSNLKLSNNLETIDAYAFNRCKGIKNISIPDSINTIGIGAFNGCTGLTNVTIGRGITSIDKNAFSGCTSMKCYDFTACTIIPILLDANAFSNIPADCTIKVPAELIEEWKNTDHWREYKNHFVGVSPTPETITIYTSEGAYGFEVNTHNGDITTWQDLVNSAQNTTLVDIPVDCYSVSARNFHIINVTGDLNDTTRVLYTPDNDNLNEDYDISYYMLTTSDGLPVHATDSITFVNSYNVNKIGEEDVKYGIINVVTGCCNSNDTYVFAFNKTDLWKDFIGQEYNTACGPEYGNTSTFTEGNVIDQDYAVVFNCGDCGSGLVCDVYNSNEEIYNCTNTGSIVCFAVS